MSHVVILLSSDQISNVKRYYSTHLIEKLPPGSLFAAQLQACTITAYKSGKVLFQGEQAASEASRWGTAAPSESLPSIKQHRFSPPPHIGSMSIIGSDEVGTGDFFGPITVVAVYADREHLTLLKEIGVKDSKHLKDPQILEIGEQLKELVPYSLLVCANPKYNALQAQGMSQGKMKALLHNQAIKHVIKKIAPVQTEGILIDQFAQPDVFFNYLKGQEVFTSKSVYLSTKAEGIHLGVAAASILARYAFVKHFDILSERAGFKIPKGAGQAVDQAAARLIHEKGIEALNSFTKIHFANTEKAKVIYRNTYQ